MFGVIPAQGYRVDFSLVKLFGNLADCGAVCEGSKPGHGDGWGIAYWTDHGASYLGREPNDASMDPGYEAACEKGKDLTLSSPIMAHLRKASVGLKVRENTHPFIIGSWAFAHNGTIRKLNLKYITDSKWFFESIMRDAKSDGGNVIGAISKNVKIVREIYPYSSITFLLSNGIDYIAYRDAAENVDYYTLYYAKTPQGFYLSQEKFFDAPWRELENRSLLIARRDFSFEVQPILPEILPRSK
jgi:predicted glutamine amidotransferase